MWVTVLHQAEVSSRGPLQSTLLLLYDSVKRKEGKKGKKEKRKKKRRKKENKEERKKGKKMWDLSSKVFNFGHSPTLFCFESGFNIKIDHIFGSHFQKSAKIKEQ